MHDIWTTLPRELINVVLEYDDTIRLRHGKYMNRISKYDFRYLPLFLRPKCRLVIWDDDSFEATVINKKGRKLRIITNLYWTNPIENRRTMNI